MRKTILQFYILFIIFASSCSGEVEPHIEHVPDQDGFMVGGTDIGNAGVYIATIIPTPTLVPTPTPAPIDVYNADKVELFKRFGQGVVSNSLGPSYRTDGYHYHYIGMVNNIDFSPDDRLLAIGTSVGIWLYDVSNLSSPIFNQYFDTQLYDIVFSPDGTLLALGFRNGSVFILELADKSFVYQVENHLYGSVLQMAFSPINNNLVVGYTSGRVEVFDIEKKELIAKTQVEPRVTKLKFSPNGELLMVVSYYYKLQVFETDKWNTIYKVSYTYNSNVKITDVVFSNEGSKFYTWSLDGLLRETRISDGVETSRIIVTDGKNRYGVFSPSHDYLCIISYSELRKIPFNSGSLDEALQITQEFVSTGNIKYSDSEEFIAGVREDGSVWVLNQKTDEITEVEGFSNPQKYTLFTLVGKDMIVISTTEIDVWDSQLWEKRKTIDMQYSWGQPLVLISPDGKYIRINKGYSGEPIVLNTETWEENTYLDLDFSDWLNSEITYSSDGSNYLIADGHISIYRVKDRELLRRFSVEEGSPYDAIYVQEDHFIVSAHPQRYKLLNDGQYEAINYGLIQVRENTDEQILNVLSIPGHTASVNDLALSPEGDIFASASDDETIKLWQVGTWEMLASLEAHTDDVNSVNFSPDGKYLVSASEDGTFIVWRVIHE